MKNKILIGAGVLVIIIIIGILVLSKDCKTAGCYLDKQVILENKIKILKAELDGVIKTKQSLYVEGINEGVQTGAFTQAPQQEQTKLPTLSGTK